MPRIKIPEEQKRQKLGTTIDVQILKLMDELLKEKQIYNKSQYIEDLIKKDLIKNNKIKI
jgi:metal-responsive CopG/Arc/MetJ family transcriptional regulator